MNHLRILALTLGLTFFVGCFGPPAEPIVDKKPERPRISEEELERRKREDGNRRYVLDRYKKKYGSSDEVCDDEDRDHECRDICDDIYSNRGDRDDCEEEFTVEQIERLEDLYKILEKPKERDLANVDFEDLEAYLNLSSEGFKDLIGKYSSSRAEDFFFWMIENEEVAELIEGEEDDYNILEALLAELVGDNDIDASNIVRAFDENIDGGDSLMEVAIQQGGDDLIEWFMDFIISDQGADDVCDNDTSVGCFTIYCKIGKNLDEDYRQDLLGFEAFEDYIKDIISKETNAVSPTDASKGNKWCGEKSKESTCDREDIIEDEDDVDDWMDDLCGGLT